MRGIFCMHWTYEEKCPFLNYSLGLVRVLIFDTGSQHIYTLRFRKEAILDHLQLSDVTVSIYIYQLGLLTEELTENLKFETAGEWRPRSIITWSLLIQFPIMITNDECAWSKKHHNGTRRNRTKNRAEMVWNGGDCHRLGNSLLDKCFKMYEVCFLWMHEKVVHFSIPLQINASWSIGFLMVSSATYCFL